MELTVLLSGTQSGAFYGLLALGYFLVMRATGVVNFAIGSFVMFAALTTAYVTVERSSVLVIGSAAAVATAVLLAWVTEVAIVRPMQARTRGDFGAVMALVALLFVLEQAAGLIFGRRPLRGPELLEGSIQLARGRVDLHDLVGLAATVVVFVVVAMWLQRGRYGRMLRAVGDNQVAAKALGLPVRRVRVVAVCVAGFICGLAGLIVAPQTAVSFQSDLPYSILAFVALVLGGMGNAWAPLVGGLLLGLIEVYTARLFGGAFHDYVILALVLVLFTFRPEGLFSIRVRA